MEKEIGKVSHYFGHIGVAAIELSADGLKIGDTIHIKGHTTDFTQKIESIQIEHKGVEQAKKGDSIGIKANERVREHDLVYLVTE